MLQYNPDWDYQSPGPIPDSVHFGFLEIINRVAGRGPAKDVYDHFKGYFASAAGTSAGSSSSESWAVHDLENYMRGASSNAPLFIDAFVTAWMKLGERNVSLPPPNIDHVNKLLADADAGYQIRESRIVPPRWSNRCLSPSVRFPSMSKRKCSSENLSPHRAAYCPKAADDKQYKNCCGCWRQLRPLSRAPLRVKGP